MSTTAPEKPSVLFVCIHNAGRSQMAAAYLTHLAGDRVEVRSAGSAPADSVNPAAVAAMTVGAGEAAADEATKASGLRKTEHVKKYLASARF